MTTTNDSLKLAELLKTPICKMDGEELAFLITSITSNQQAQMLLTQPKQEEHNVYGIAGIAQIFGCSIPTASPDIRLQHTNGQPYQEEWYHQ